MNLQEIQALVNGMIPYLQDLRSRLYIDGIYKSELKEVKEYTLVAVVKIEHKLEEIKGLLND